MGEEHTLRWRVRAGCVALCTRAGGLGCGAGDRQPSAAILGKALETSARALRAVAEKKAGWAEWARGGKGRITWLEDATRRAQHRWMRCGAEVWERRYMTRHDAADPTRPLCLMLMLCVCAR